MSDSGIGMLPGRLSTDLPWLWFIGAFLLGAVLVHGVAKAGRLRRRERRLQFGTFVLRNVLIA